MNIDQLKQQFPTEASCRDFFEAIMWPEGRICPHCSSKKSYIISCKTARVGLYQCGKCHRQFSVTTKTPMHSTKLCLWKWILAMYCMVNSSKGVSSVIMAKWIGVSQKTAWKICHAIRELMRPSNPEKPLLKNIVELDEKYIGGKPRYQNGITHKPGKATEKQCVFVAVERQGPVCSALIDSDRAAEIFPVVNGFVDKSAHLMTDHNKAYLKIGQQFASHSWVNHSEKEYARGDVHNNTAESFNALLERAKMGVFHYLSKKHLQRYIHEIGFRWNHREPVKKKSANGEEKIIMKPLPVMDMIVSVLRRAAGRQIRRSAKGGILIFDQVFA
jgi:transposase-like protein